MDIEIVKLLLNSLGIFSVSAVSILLVTGYIGKKLFEKFLSNKLEAFKLGINKDFEKYKIELQLITSKFQIQFSKLHQERAETIKDIYTRIVEINRGIQRFTSLDFRSDSDLERINKTFDDFWSLKRSFEKNKIIFDKELAFVLVELLNKYQDCVFSYRRIVDSEQKLESNFYKPFIGSKKYHAEIIDKNWDKIENLINEEASKILINLEDKFRLLLGVEDDKINNR